MISLWWFGAGIASPSSLSGSDFVLGVWHAPYVDAPTLITVASFALGFARRLSWHDPEMKGTGVSEPGLLDHGVGRCFGLGRGCGPYLSTSPFRDKHPGAARGL